MEIECYVIFLVYLQIDNNRRITLEPEHPVPINTMHAMWSKLEQRKQPINEINAIVERPVMQLPNQPLLAKRASRCSLNDLGMLAGAGSEGGKTALVAGGKFGLLDISTGENSDLLGQPFSMSRFQLTGFSAIRDIPASRRLCC
jgi:hypothetical protein